MPGMTPILLDHRGEPIRRNPLAPRRLDNRSTRYDAAQTGRDNQNHWAMASGLSAAAANSPDVRRTLRNRSRYEVANNSYACGMIRTLANDTIGTGPSLQMLSGDASADKQIETSFWNWFQAVRLADKLRCMRMARAVDGEVFARLFVNENLRHQVQLDLKIYEAEQFARPWAVVDTDDQSDGITFDSAGEPLTYTVLREHPGDSGVLGGGAKYEIVPADLIIHQFRRERPGQLRGVPEITPSLPLYAQLRRFTLATLDAAEHAADVAVLMRTQQNTTLADDSIEPLDIFELERGTIMTLPKGWEASQIASKHPSTTYEMFKREIINEIARCLNMPYNVAAGDSSRYNYASGRMDHQVYFKSIAVDRSAYEADLDRVFAKWWEIASLVTRVGDAEVLPPQMTELFSPPPHAWRWDGREHVDPSKEANAAVTLNDAGLQTDAEFYGKQGKDWEEQHLQKAKELGVSVEEYRRLRREKLFGAPQRGQAQIEQALERLSDLEERFEEVHRAG